jgi:AmmeMemoRadiSam system protein A
MTEIYLSGPQRKQLLQLARKTISARLQERQLPDWSKLDEQLKDDGAAFVTLRIDGQLRGCIGYTEAFQPLAKTVQDCSLAAAFQDPRFHPLLESEWPAVKIEVSVLTPMRQIDSIEEIEVGRHGLMISAHGRRGLLLPQVATEQGWDLETFLSHTCYKAGLPTDQWRKPETEIYIFEAEIFEETESA